MLEDIAMEDREQDDNTMDVEGQEDDTKVGAQVDDVLNPYVVDLFTFANPIRYDEQ